MVKKSNFVQNKIGQTKLFNLVAIFGVVFAFFSTYLFGKRDATGRITYNVCQGTSQAFQVWFSSENNCLNFAQILSSSGQFTLGLNKDISR